MEDYKKKYEDALKRANELHSEDAPAECKDACEYIFPELADSEDEKIRKKAIEYIDAFVPYDDKEEIIAYLEKQKEQKPAEWSGNDEKIRRNLMSLLANMRGDRITEETYQKYYPWLKSLRPSWKPSEGQMLALQVAAITSKTDFNTLTSLMIDLKKL